MTRRSFTMDLGHRMSSRNEWRVRPLPEATTWMGNCWASLWTQFRLVSKVMHLCPTWQNSQLKVSRSSSIRGTALLGSAWLARALRMTSVCSRERTFSCIIMEVLAAWFLRLDFVLILSYFDRGRLDENIVIAFGAKR